MAAKRPPVYVLKVTLQDSDPPIWRRLAIKPNTSLAKLHEIIQVAFGWRQAHLHFFIVGEKRYGPAQPDLELSCRDERKVQLKSIVSKPGDTFLYEYDFGDHWVHEVTLEEIQEPEFRVRYPKCLAGERACPPEDCGGIPGYYELLEILADPKHEEHKERLKWLGGRKLDPEAFSLKWINSFLWGI